MKLDCPVTVEATRCESHIERVLPASVGPREFFLQFFRRFEQRGIPYVILRSDEEFPAGFSPDVDFAVGEADMPNVGPILAELAREHRWVVVQVIQHELFATSCLVIDPENSEQHLRLNVCSHFARNRCLLVRDAVLIGNRRRHAAGFFVPAPASEFIHLLTEALAKGGPPAEVLPRLRELWRLDPAGVQQRVDDLFGKTARTVEDWLGGDSGTWEESGGMLRARTGYGPALLLAEALRRVRCAMRPAGLHIALIGPAGAVQSALLTDLKRLLAPCFAEQRLFNFHPNVSGLGPTPNASPPHSRIVSWAKIAWHFVEVWIGFFVWLLPARRRGELVVVEPNFDDIAVEQRKYRLQGVGTLAGVLRRFVPRAAMTFIMEADSRLLHARKPDQPIEELERQRQAYKRLAAGSDRMCLVSADEPSDDVARKVCREVVSLLAHREGRRSVRAGKRIFDMLVASLVLLLFSPLLLVVALLVRWKLGSPVIFKQERPGLHGRTFTICKFRTMTDARDASGRRLPDAQRLTRFGKWLRSTSLDELPELWNILKGDMSLVGPRPLLTVYLPRYSPEQMRRHDVLPGVTGWAQVNGRNAATWPEKFQNDVWYVDHQSFWLDLKIIWLTFWTVLKREGINQPGFATAEHFWGNEARPEREREKQLATQTTTS
jgi:sugar transferase EpsL